ncbi:ABC transporter substrate-binding protein (plasmid) [Nicoliella spurrieriana]|uniref:ABC transporter substrate-binding protein n=1 Tax=Nicoliella spurrieriana TaxID=2925830 RepID=A0A976RQS2_9LACO|nr:ABC transporter substrate-binding protein [Nicoliella spurrieriana]UQS86078.1 ABC transporter substrate-binding protein [Nicoliella spurrieriana]
MKKRSWIISICGIILIGFLGVLFTYRSSADQSSESTQSNQRIKITFWHEMTGPGAAEIQQFANGFNKEQSKYEIVPEFEGDYNQVIQKVLQTHGTNASPALFQSMDVSTGQMRNANITTPVQKFIDQDKYDMSKIMPAARAFYSKNGQQLSMPFNTSQPTLFYNKAVFRKYGIKDLPTDPSYDDIEKAAKEIADKSKGAVKGITVDPYGWYFEEFMANSGQSLANMNDGHDGFPTKVNFTNQATVNAMNWLQKMNQNGSFISYGSGSTSASNEIASFLSGKLGIMFQSSASMGQLEAASKPGDLGVTYYPRANGQTANGVAIGGASLWIANDKDSATQRGAWEFIKYLMQPANQAQWQNATGYIALNKDSQNEPVLKELYKKHPEAQIPSNQLARTKPNSTNSGILMEGLVQMRTITQNAMQQIYAGRNVNDALKDAQDQFNSFLTQHNKANGYSNK